MRACCICVSVMLLWSVSCCAQDRLVKEYPKGKYHVLGGPVISMNLGFNLNAFGTLQESEISSHVGLQYGRFLNQHVLLSLGFGGEFNRVNVAGFIVDTQINPIYLEGRYYPIVSRFLPFVYGRIGYGLNPNTRAQTGNNKSGGQYQAGMGLIFTSRSNRKIYLTLGIYGQALRGDEAFLDAFGNEVLVDYDLWTYRPILKVGMDLMWN